MPQINEKNFTLPIIPDLAAKIIPLALDWEEEGLSSLRECSGDMSSKRQPKKLKTFWVSWMSICLNLVYERRDESTKKIYLHPIHWTQSVNIHACVCFCSTSFCDEKEKIVADITSIESFTNNCKHTYSSRNSVSYHHICNFFSLFFLRGCGAGFQTPRRLWLRMLFFHCFYMETLAAILPPLMSLAFTKSDNKKWSLNLAWNIKLERVVSVFCILPMLKSSSTKNYGLTWLRHCGWYIGSNHLVVRQTPEGDLLRSLVGLVWSGFPVASSSLHNFFKFFFKRGLFKNIHIPINSNPYKQLIA